jgi:hypothetical protein
MSDFSDLCPLFNTGAYGEIMAPHITLVTRTTSEHFWSFPPFGRSVIVTDFYVAKHTTFAATCTALKLIMFRAATKGTARGAATAFASIVLSATITVQPIGRCLTGTTTDTTFSATQILKFFCNKSEAGAKHVSVIVRYKEK